MSKVAIITGASQGIGAATALQLAAEGYAICVNYHSQAKLAQQVVDKITGLGGSAIAVQADVADEAQVQTLFATVAQQLGTLSVLVNNAGILFQQGPITQMDAVRINKVLATNVTGYFLCCKHAVFAMSTDLGGAGGVIINVSSAASRLGSAGEYIDYAASKGAVDTLTIGLAKEVAEQGIRVNAVRPGIIYTNMHSTGGEPERVDRVKVTVPLKRGGRPEEVAAAISWLASTQSSYCTGSFIDVSGGR